MSSLVYNSLKYLGQKHIIVHYNTLNAQNKKKFQSKIFMLLFCIVP